MRNRLSQGLQLARPLAATLMFDHPTIEAIAKFLAREWEFTNSAGPAKSARPGEPPVSRAQQVADLSDEEVERLLLGKLGAK